MHKRLAGAGVQVATAEPGFVCTRMTDGMNLPAGLTAEPEELPSAVVEAIHRRRDVVYRQPIWGFIVLVFRAIPERFFNRMNGEGSDTARHLDNMAIFLYQKSSTGIYALLDRVAAARHPLFLASLKLFGPVSEGLLSFPMEGYTLALASPLRTGTPALLTTLNEITHRYGGRVYLAKEVHCTPERLRQGYPHHAMFNTIRTESADLSSKFASALSRRLAL